MHSTRAIYLLWNACVIICNKIKGEYGATYNNLQKNCSLFCRNKNKTLNLHIKTKTL